MRSQEPLTRQQAFNYVLRLLQQRNYSEAMLRQKLSLRKVAKEDSDFIVEKLKHMNLINDTRYAASLIRNEASFRHASTRWIAQKLRAKGIDSSLIAQSFSEQEDIPEEIERARYHAEKYLKHKTPDKQKLYAYLARKGFSGSVIQRAVKDLLA